MSPEWEIILGPPGTGKTTTLLGILEEELGRGTPPDRIGLVTFTVKAAREAQERVAEKFNLTRADLPHFRTMHSLAMQWAGLSGGELLTGDRVAEFAEWIGEEIEGRRAIDGVWDGYKRGDRMLFMDNLARIQRRSLREVYDDDHDDLNWSDVERFSRGLREYKQQNQLHDFTDMIELMIARGRRPRLDVLLGDESQDFSRLQWDAFTCLAQDCGRVVVAGDDDQAIFVWAGADVDYLIDLPGRVRVLDQSYRIPRAVQRVAASVIGSIRHRRPKTWRPRDDEGVVHHIPDIGMAPLDGPSTLILARNRYQLASMERSLRGAGYLYEKEGFPSVSRKTLEAIVTWERLRRGEAVQAGAVVAGPYALMGVGRGVQRGYKRLPGVKPDAPVTLADLTERGGLLRTDVWWDALDKLSPEDRSYLIACRRNRERLTQAPRIRLSTIHGAKGGEANRVILTTDIAPRTWSDMHARPDDETRVLYVAVTRAREELYVVAPTTRRSYTV